MLIHAFIRQIIVSQIYSHITFPRTYQQFQYIRQLHAPLHTDILHISPRVAQCDDYLVTLDMSGTFLNEQQQINETSSPKCSRCQSIVIYLLLLCQALLFVYNQFYLLKCQINLLNKYIYIYVQCVGTELCITSGIGYE